MTQPVTKINSDLGDLLHYTNQPAHHPAELALQGGKLHHTQLSTQQPPHPWQAMPPGTYHHRTCSSSLKKQNHNMSSAVCLPATCKSSLFLRLSSLSSSIEDRLPSKGVFHQKLSSIKGHLPSKVVFHRRSSSIKGCLPLKVIFHRRSSSSIGHLPAKVIFH